MEENTFDFEAFKAQAIKGMYEGKPHNREKGILAPLLKHFLETILEAKHQTHLEKEEQKGNCKNGKMTKTVQSISGEFALTTSRHRDSSFEPIILSKRQVTITYY